MDRWRTTKLGDLLTLQRGYDLPERLRQPGAVPIVSSSGITGYHDKAKIQCPGVVTGRYGTLGEVFYIEQEFWPLNTALFVSDFKGNQPRFVAYLLRTLAFSRQSAAGAVPGVNRNHLHALDVRAPDVPTQQRIAGILSAYDDLIENNTKRIRLLQRNTDLTFRHIEIAMGSSWKTRTLGDLADTAGGTIRTGPFGSQLHEADYTAQGTPVVMPKNLIGSRIDTSDIARIPDEHVERLAQHKLVEGDIVYGRRGDIGRRAFVRRRQVGWLCGTGCLRISLPDGALSSRYLHQYLGKPDVVAMIAGRAIGATMPNLNTSILRDVPIAVPSHALQLEFTRNADANDELIDVLVEQIDNLCRQRDLLLPRLISGELDVSSLSAPPTA